MKQISKKPVSEKQVSGSTMNRKEANAEEANQKGRSDQFDQEGQRDDAQVWHKVVETAKQLVIISYQALITADRCRTISYWDFGDAILKLRTNRGVKHGEWLVFVRSRGSSINGSRKP